MKYYCKNNSCYFKSLPFYWHPLENYRVNKFLEFLPFELFYDRNIGLLRQRPWKQVIEVLTSAYREGSEIVGLMDNHGIGYDYTQDFLDFLDNAIGLRNVIDKEILEIGCGTGYLLYRLKLLGSKVTGYEPGFLRIGKYQVPVIEKFFPSEEIEGKKFDIIIAYGLLEHLIDINNMLFVIHKYLKNSGALVVSVPDCKEYIINGDISMLLHEHFSYFTKDSFQFLMEKKGFATQTIKESGFGGCLYGFFKKNGNPKVKSQKNNIMLEDVFEKIDKNIQKMNNFINQHKNKSLGIYVPIRAVNILSLFRDLIRNLNISLRFFDDSFSLIGKYLPGYKIRIEDRNSLIKNPTDIILVYSYTFGKRIAEELKNTLPQQVEIINVKDL